MENLKLHWAPENYKKTIDSYDDRISKLKKEKGWVVWEYIRQNSFIPTQRDKTVWIDVEMEYADREGNSVVESLHRMALGYYAVQKGTNCFFEECTVTPILYPRIGNNYIVVDKSRRFMLQNFVHKGTVEIRYKEERSDTYYYSNGGNFEEMKVDDENSKWHGGERENAKYVEMCVCGANVREVQEIEDID